MAQPLERYLVEQFERDRIVALLIDEAQDLDDALLDQLRSLADMERDSARLLQLVLVGQPSLDERLAMPLFAPLHECIGLRSHLRPLTYGEIPGYVNYRLMAVGYCGEPIFTAPAIERIAAFSRGIPRLINVICDNALLTACAMAQPRVDAAIIDDVADELQLGAPADYTAHWTAQAQQISAAPVTEKPLDYGVADVDRLPAGQAAKYLPDNRASVTPLAIRSARTDKSPSRAVLWPGLALGFAALIGMVAAFATVPSRSSNSFESVRANINRIQQAITPLSGRFYRLLTLRSESPEATVASYTDQKLAEIGPAWRAPVQPQRAVSNDKSKGLNQTRNRGGKTLSQPQPAPPQTAVPHAPDERSKASVTRARPVELVVVDNSFVRTQATSEAEIVMALRPGTHVQVVNRRGDYLLVRAPESGLNQGFVHKEDAFFEPIN
jgi:hypothetical protein